MMAIYDRFGNMRNKLASEVGHGAILTDGTYIGEEVYA